MQRPPRASPSPAATRGDAVSRGTPRCCRAASARQEGVPRTEASGTERDSRPTSCIGTPVGPITAARLPAPGARVAVEGPRRPVGRVDASGDDDRPALDGPGRHPARTTTPARADGPGHLPHGRPLLPETTPRALGHTRPPRIPATGARLRQTHGHSSPETGGGPAGHGPPTDNSDARGHDRFAARRSLASPGSTAAQPSGDAPSRRSHDHRPAAPRRRSTAQLPQPGEPGPVPRRMAPVRGVREP